MTSPAGSHARRRREEILEASSRLFAARGFVEVGIDEIGDTVGISGPAVYHYFPTKQRILSALFERGLRGILSDVADIEDSRKSPSAQVAALIERHVRRAGRDRNVSRVCLTSAGSLPPDDAPRVRQLQREYTEHWAKLLRRLDASADEHIAVVRAQVLLGVVNSVVNWPDDDTLDAAESEVIRLACRMVGVRPPRS